MGTPPDLDRLLENASWVRALGLELAGASEADDLTQDAWVVALEERGRALAPAAWLSGVVRKLASRRRRAAERRARRERAVARPEAQPGAHELVAEAELQRRLIEEVTRLDEPYRSAVLLRFYRGWTSAEIARSLGVPGATVRTRLARALARLRERLDRAHGGREAWAVCFASPATLGAGAATITTSTMTTATITEGVLMSVKLKIACGVALAALTGLAVWRTLGRSGEPRTRVEEVAVVADVGPPGASSAALDPVAAAQSDAARLPIAPESSARRAPDEVLVYGSVADAGGRALELESLDLEDEHGTPHGASTGVGSFSLAGLVPGRYTLRARAEGFVSLREELELHSDQEHQRCDLVLAAALSIPLKILDESGNLLGLELQKPARMLDVVVTRAAPTEGLCGLRTRPGSLYGCGDFEREGKDHPAGLPAGYSGLLRLRTPPPVYVSVILQDATLATRRVDGPLGELVFTLERARIERQLGGLRARFVDALTGRPILAGKAALDLPSYYSGGGSALDADARAVFAERAPGLHTLRLFHAEYERFERGVRVPAGRVEDLGDVTVWPRAILRGSVLDAQGRPVSASLRVLSRSELRDPSGVGGWTVRTFGGRFELESVPRGPVQLVVGAPGHAALTRTIDASSGLVEGLVLRLETGVSVVLRTTEAAAGRQVTLADESGVPFATWTVTGRAITTRLVPGRYQLWTGVAERVDEVEELIVGNERVERAIGNGR